MGIGNKTHKKEISPELVCTKRQRTGRLLRYKAFDPLRISITQKGEIVKAQEQNS